MAAPPKAVILLEDEPDIAALLAQLISSYGATPIICHNLEGILDALNSRDIALALLDIMLPQLDGRMVAAALHERRVPFPIYFMTGIDPKHIGDFYSGLAAGILHKPFSIKELRTVLDNGLSGQPAMMASNAKRQVIELMAAVASEQENIRRRQSRLMAIARPDESSAQMDAKARAEMWQEFGMSLEACLARQASRLAELRALLEDLTT